ncbi:head-tail joining protein [Lysobacter antibioticus]|jgi:hypothetical protein|uniref:head-tail joining protein n=1 Tax=Lysobacter antibioticus TaxID=84531 RepID=UPI000A62008A|nr:hypothetical protein [Lysobacter antibioticus]
MTSTFEAMDDVLFESLGVVARIERDGGHTVRSHIVVRDGVERLGEFQQIVGRARHVVVRNREWLFRRGDEITFDGRTQAVEVVVRDDGLINEAILHG